MKIAPSEDVIVGTTPLENELAGVHPRLHATAADFEALRTRVKREPLATLYRKLLGAAEHAIAHPCPAPAASEGKDLRGYIGEGLPPLALAWRLTGEKKYFDSAVDFMTTAMQYEDWTTSLIFGHWGHGMAIGYDWLYHDLDPALRERIAGCLNEHARKMFDAWGSYQLATGIFYTFNHMAVPLAGLAAAGAALYGEEPAIGPWLRMVLDKARLSTTALAGDGASQEGINYGGYFLNFLLRTLDLVDRLLGVDLITPCEFLRNVPYFYIYSALPRHAWSERQLLFHFGDAFPSDWAPSPERILASKFRHGHAQWFADETERQGGMEKGGHFLNVLWYDRSVKPKPPDKLPTLRHFEDKDIVFLRGDWSGDEAAFAFKCGPHSGHKAAKHYHHEIGGGHMHPDAGTILLCACGDWLLADDGYAAKFTRQQNTVLVNGVGQTGEGGDWFEGVYLRQERRWPYIVRVDTTPACDYAIGNAAPAYERNAGLTTFLRHVLYVKPDTWVLFDELETIAPATFELFFHANHPFRAEENNRYVQNAPKGSLQVLALRPRDVAGTVARQTIRATGHSPNREMEVLVLSNREKTAKALFITVLHTYPTAGQPVLTARLEESDRSLELILERAGQVRRLPLSLQRARIKDPIVAW